MTISSLIKAEFNSEEKEQIKTVVKLLKKILLSSGDNDGLINDCLSIGDLDDIINSLVCLIQ
ncbi:hypothetical protein J6A31_08315 [bacterium]|nr:hypothetical protein [bacterium]